MIKTFENFVNEGANGGNLSATAMNKDKDMSLDIDVIESNNVSNLPDHELSASIYVMPDDTVEIRTIEHEYIHAVVNGITGEDVRKESLHRDNWVVYIN